jgi:large subunit ribosomal protein L18
MPSSSTTRPLERLPLHRTCRTRAGDGDKITKAKRVGKKLAESARAAGVERAVFDRGGRLYHGRVKAVAEGAREGGLQI